MSRRCSTIDTNATTLPPFCRQSSRSPRSSSVRSRRARIFAATRRPLVGAAQRAAAGNQEEGAEDRQLTSLEPNDNLGPAGFLITPPISAVMPTTVLTEETRYTKKHASGGTKQTRTRKQKTNFWSSPTLWVPHGAPLALPKGEGCSGSFKQTNKKQKLYVSRTASVRSYPLKSSLIDMHI